MYLSRISATAWCLSASPQGLCLSLAAGNLPRSGASWRRTRHNSRNNIWGNIWGAQVKATTSCKRTWDWRKWPVQDLVLVMFLCPLRRNNFEGREEGGQYYISQTCNQQRCEARKIVFCGCVSTFLQLVVATSVKFQAFKLRGRCKEMYCSDGYICRCVHVGGNSETSHHTPSPKRLSSVTG